MKIFTSHRSVGKSAIFLDHWGIWHGLHEGILNVASCISRILPRLTVPKLQGSLMFVGCTGCFFRFLSFFYISLTWAWGFGMKVFANKFHFNICSFQCFSDFFLPAESRMFFWRVSKSRPHKKSQDLTYCSFVSSNEMAIKKNYTCHYSNSPAKSQHPPIPRKT